MGVNRINLALYRIWEMLLPCYDSVSDIILNLLMKLLSSDPAPFHACVYKVFEDANWEVRSVLLYFV